MRQKINKQLRYEKKISSGMKLTEGESDRCKKKTQYKISGTNENKHWAFERH